MIRNRIEPDRRLKRAAALAGVLLGLALGSWPAAAQLPGERDTRLDLGHGGERIVQNGSISLDEAVAIARRRFEGRVVRAETRNVNGRDVHVIRILDSNGRVRNVQIDAETGRVRG